MSFQSSLSGIGAASEKLDVIGVNVANAQTVGFKETNVRFQDIYANKMEGGQFGSGSVSAVKTQAFTQGGLQQSDNALDMAINGKGFFQVMRSDGSLAYTRTGQFHVDKDKYLVTPEGDKVMGASGPIQIDSAKYGNTIRISSDGVIQASDGVTRGPSKEVPDPVSIGKTITQQGDLVYQTIGAVQLHEFRNEDGLESLGDNLWGETSASGARIFGQPGSGVFGTVESGMTEASNVDLNENLVDMIVAQREYQGNAQALKIQVDMDTSLAKL
ncbi:MAG: flagellar hook basal-body protein [Sulfuricella sp.]|nr:flagellar hook basal-body protein [Sulfuricella sp.]